MRVLIIVLSFMLSSVQGPAFGQNLVAPETKSQIKLTFAPVVKSSAPAVVNIYTRRVIEQRVPNLFNDPFFRRFFGENFQQKLGMPKERIQNSLGSGVLVRRDGMVITNNHVIAGSDEITVVLADRREFDAEVVGTDERTDLAVIRINNAPDNLPWLPLGDSDKLEVGDLVLAIGNPFGVGQTVTSGIVSALARSNVGVTDFRSFIQTDAAINPGNSGGALVTIDGNLVGINTAIYSQDGSNVGIGFAIPTPMVRFVLDSILKEGKAIRAWLGATGQSVSAEIAAALGIGIPRGVIVNEVYPGSPAAKAGITEGDILLSINNKALIDKQNLRYRLATLAIGNDIIVKVWRSGEEKRFNVMLSQPPDVPDRNVTGLNDDTPPFGGATVANLNPALAEELGIEEARGVIILSLKRRSFARQSGLSPGDIILYLNKKKVDNVNILKEQINKPARRWTYSLKRGGRVIERSVGL